MTISKYDVYRACYCFLNLIWEQDKQTFPDDLPILLSDMQLLSDGKSADPAVIHDWNELANAEAISIEQGYRLVMEFLQLDSGAFYNNNETRIIIEKMETDHKSMWDLWNRYVNEILKS